MVSIIHASDHNVNMIMVTEIIEIDTTKADTSILMMHGNIKYSNYVIINANNNNVQIL